MCVLLYVFVSPQAEKADNWRRHVPQSGDCSGGRLQSAVREVHEIIKEIIIRWREAHYSKTSFAAGDGGRSVMD